MFHGESLVFPTLQKFSKTLLSLKRQHCFGLLISCGKCSFSGPSRVPERERKWVSKWIRNGTETGSQNGADRDRNRDYDKQK